VLSAVLLLAMAVYMAFVVDLGYIVVVRNQAQNCADAAALAGAWAMVNDDRIRGYDHSVFYRTRSEAMKFAAMNAVGPNEHPVVRRNVFNIDPKGDILLGRLENSTDLSEQLQLEESMRCNAVQVNVRCTRGRNQQSPLFFARILGMTSFDMEATATAVFNDRIRGFRIVEGGPPSTLMPFVVDHDYWIDMIVRGGGDDDWTIDLNTKTVLAGPDDIRELDMFPDKVWDDADAEGGNGNGNGGGNSAGSGNFGTVDIGNHNNATGDLMRQILKGPSAEDLDTHGGELALDKETGTLILEGDTGISAAIQEALDDVVGTPKTIMLYDRVTGHGNNTRFRIVGFVGIRIVDLDLSGGAKYVRIQPTFVTDPTAIGDGGLPGETYFVGEPVRLVR
jgi:hypothetical protein